MVDLEQPNSNKALSVHNGANAADYAMFVIVRCAAVW
jgi:hypothetical protein